MELAARQIVQALRGNRSQRALSRRLGFKSNVVGRWESGTRFPGTTQVLRACEQLGIDSRAAFARFHPTLPLLDAGLNGLSKWLNALRGSQAVSALASSVGVSRFTMSRWLNGGAEPRLHEFLQIVESLTGRACDLVAELLPIAGVPALAEPYRARLEARHLAHSEPWTEAIMRVLEGGEADPRGLAAQLGIELNVAERCLKALVRSRIVAEQEGRYRAIGVLTVDTRAANDLRAHWCSVAHERSKEPQSSDIFSYNLLSVGRQDLEDIRQLLRATYRQVRAIVADSQHTDCAALVSLQLLTWERPSATVSHRE